MKTITILKVGVLLMAGYTVHAQPNLIVSGSYTGNHLWQSDTIKVAGDVTIAGTLQITSGTYIEFQGHYNISADTIFALGSRGDTITFTIKDTTGFSQQGSSAGGWKGLWADYMELDYCRIRFIKDNDALGLNNTMWIRGKIRHSKFDNNHCHEMVRAGFERVGIKNDVVFVNTSFICNHFDDLGRVGHYDSCQFLGNNFRIATNSYTLANCYFANNKKIVLFASESAALIQYCHFEKNDTLKMSSSFYGKFYISSSLFANNHNTVFESRDAIDINICNNTFFNNHIKPGYNALFNFNMCEGGPVFRNNILIGSNRGLSQNKLLSFNDRGVVTEGDGQILNNLLEGGLDAVECTGELHDSWVIFDRDPMFIDTLCGNFHLGIHSPCINSGFYIYRFYIDSLDLDGKPRIADQYVDIGAYEFQSDTFDFWMQPEGFTACAGMSAQLTANASGGITGYQWQKDGTDLPGENSRILKFPDLNSKHDGIYKVIVTHFPGSDTSCSAEVHVRNIPHLFLGHDTAFCAPATLILGPKEAYQRYAWNTGSQEGAIEIDKSGIYWLNVTDTNGCSNTDSIWVVVFPMPVISLGNDTSIKTTDTLYLSPGAGFESYLWNTGDDNQFLMVYNKQIGVYDYSVLVTDTNGCSAGDTVIVSVEVASEVSPKPWESALKAFPNPTTGILNLVSTINLYNIEIEVFDLRGQKVLQRKIGQLKAGDYYGINLSSLPPGVYQLLIGNKQIRITKE